MELSFGLSLRVQSLERRNLLSPRNFLIFWCHLLLVSSCTSPLDMCSRLNDLIVLSPVLCFCRDFVSPFVIFTYHLDDQWLHASSDNQHGLTTLSRGFHTLDLVTSISPTALLRFLIYLVRLLRRKPHVELASDSIESPILKMTVIGPIVVLSTPRAIRAVDTSLHEQITSTIMPISHRNFSPSSDKQLFAQDAKLLPQTTVSLSTEWSLGGQSQSSIFEIYENGSSDLSRKRSIALIDASYVTSHTGLKHTAHSYVALSHVECISLPFRKTLKRNTKLEFRSECGPWYRHHHRQLGHVH